MADDKKTVQFNTTPEEVMRERRDLTPEQQANRERMAQMKKARQPLGGAPEVNIPPLNADPVEGGGPMHQQAQILQDPTSPLSPAYNPQLAQMAQERPPGEPGSGSPFAPLPPEAAKDPRFRPGVGAMVAGNQPQMAKDGGYKPHLSENTKESMRAMAEFGAQVEAKKAASQDEAAKPDPAKTEAVNKLGEGINKETELYDELRDMLDDPRQWNLLNNPDRRKKIEARLSPMEIADLIMYGEIRQDVPILPEKLTVTYRSVAAEEDLEVKRLMFGESGGDRYLMDKYTMMQLTLALVSINGEELPTHLDEKRKFNEEKFLKKVEKVEKFPIQFVADLGVQYLWFDERVRRLFIGSSDELKNS
jgi:hypothetical protein